MGEVGEMKLSRCGKNSTNDICPFCKNTGWEDIDYKGQKACVECRCGMFKKNRMKNRLKFAALPESFHSTRLRNFDLSIYKSKESQKKVSTAMKVIEYWLKNLDAMKENGIGLYLYSYAKGSGKTRMVASIANELIYEKKMQVKFATSLQILNEIKATWNKNDSLISENKLMHFLSVTEILIIDDFGMEKHKDCKDWIDDKFNDIINYRYNNKKVTIFTSNLPLDQLKYDDRITNRIMERTFQIPFPEESIREIIAKQNMMELIGGMRREENNCG